MPLAETFSFSPGEVALILVVLALMFAAWVTAAVLGFKWAARAGRGDGRAGVLWALAIVVLLLPAYPAGIGMVTIVAAGVIAAQVAIFLQARGGRGT